MNYIWNKKDYPKTHGKTVFGTFICGGGSSMGYKLAGFNHLGGVEIDPKMADVYKANHDPKYLYLMDIREFAKKDDLPKELYNLDILDGSPPCSTFSLSGGREKDWGKQKKFAEGQAKQTLDDLFFEFIKLADKLKPKIVISENVVGITLGNAKAYCRAIINQFNSIGYDIQIFKLDSSKMGVPQKRVRIFFICRRRGLGLKELKLKFNQKPILFKEVEDKKGPYESPSKSIRDRWELRAEGDGGLSPADRLARPDHYKANPNAKAFFNNCLIYRGKPFPTVVSSTDHVIYHQCRIPTTKEYVRIGSFPQDYDFGKAKPRYIIGMSVPPLMMAGIAKEIKKQWLK